MKSITVIRGGAIGDFVLTLPAIEAVRQAYPEASLRLIGRPAILRLAHPDRILDHDSPLLAPLHAPSRLLPSAVSALFADADFLLTYAADPDGVLAGHLRSLAKGPTLVHDPRPLPGAAVHITDHLLQPLRQAGIPVPDPVPRIHLREEDRDYGSACWQRYGLRSPVVVVHPGSGGRRKCWPRARFLALVNALEQRRIRTLLLRGPVEEDLQYPLPSGVLSLGPPGLLELAGLLARADLFIGNDSGPGHIAAAVGAPTLTLFGPTDPRVWSPRSPRARILQASTGQLEALAVDSVLRAVLESLEEFRRTTGATIHA